MIDTPTGQIVDVFDGRDAAGLRKYVPQQPWWWADSIAVVCVDPQRGLPQRYSSVQEHQRSARRHRGRRLLVRETEGPSGVQDHRPRTGR